MSGTPPGLARLHGLAAPEARGVFLSCCGSTRWSEQMAGRRPFATVASLHEASGTVWRGLSRADWLEAMSHHPRIGERRLAAVGAGAAQASREQSGMATATDAQRLAFEAGNAEYERRFGHVFLIFATGKGPAEMLEQLRLRLGNDAEAELRNAVEEQAKITRLRLERWLAT